MIEKKISYDINIEKPSKTKPVKQGGVLNYLGKQKTVNAPVRWRSSKDHPIAKLAYITKDEEKILIDLNLYGSLKGKPNRGPFGLPSLQGSGSGSGGDGGSSGGDSGGDSGQGDSGPGGSDDGSGHGGPGPGSGEGESTGDANDQGGTEGPSGPGPGGAEGGFGIGPDAATEAAQSEAQSISADNVSTQAQADQEDAATAAAAAAADTGIMGTVTNAVKNAIQNAVNNPVSTMVGMAFGPVAGLAARGISMAVDAANRGVTGPNDDTQESTSVQSSTQSPSGGDGGISTIQAYAPLYNPDTGNPTMDAYIRQLRINLGLPV
jgi:hypothetical protein